MTTPQAAAKYLVQHLKEWNGRPYAVFNPFDKPVDELPTIYGFNNGGSEGWWSGTIISDDGVFLGGHTCSHELYMYADLGIVEGSRSDRHETFQKHYPDGYKMDFVSYQDAREHEGLQAAFAKHKAKLEAGEEGKEGDQFPSVKIEFSSDEAA